MQIHSSVYLAMLAITACATPTRPGSASPAPETTEPSPPPVVEATAQAVYRGASVWTGNGFEALDLAIGDGHFVAAGQVADTTRVVDLTGSFVVPAYGNGHQHLALADEATNRGYLHSGVYYVWNPNSRASFITDDDRAFWARPDTYDYKTSMGGVTTPGSHPEPLYVEQLSQWVYPGATYDDFYLDAFHYARSEQEVERTLDRLVSQGADFVKAYLLGSELYTPPKADGTPTCTRGLDPALVPHLVAQAHARNLVIAFHIETRHDFRVAVDAGADFVAHLPAHLRPPEDPTQGQLLPEDAEAAAKMGLGAMPTYSIARSRADAALARGVQVDLTATYAMQAANLRLLQDAGVRLIVGTDLGVGTALGEARHWVEIGGLTPEEAVGALLATGAALFPERRIGCFEAGCEADFLVLAADPRLDMAALSAIELRVKAGTALTVTAPAEAIPARP
ncbi:MAG: amidohydrolase family protein [Deltaproteobacteria bacterium]|nr:amidohydrolase family protein [Deltaproteobacteria bacterium]